MCSYAWRIPSDDCHPMEELTVDQWSPNSLVLFLSFLPALHVSSPSALVFVKILLLSSFQTQPRWGSNLQPLDHKSHMPWMSQPGAPPVLEDGKHQMYCLTFLGWFLHAAHFANPWCRHLVVVKSSSLWAFDERGGVPKEWRNQEPSWWVAQLPHTFQPCHYFLHSLRKSTPHPLSRCFCLLTQMAVSKLPGLSTSSHCVLTYLLTEAAAWVSSAPSSSQSVVAAICFPRKSFPLPRPREPKAVQKKKHSDVDYRPQGGSEHVEWNTGVQATIRIERLVPDWACVQARMCVKLCKKCSCKKC